MAWKSNKKMSHSKNSNFSTNFYPFKSDLSTQDVNEARFARNIEWYFNCDFQTPCVKRKYAGFPYGDVLEVFLLCCLVNDVRKRPQGRRPSPFFYQRPKWTFFSGITCSAAVIYDKDFIVQYFLPESTARWRIRQSDIIAQIKNTSSIIKSHIDFSELPYVEAW